MNARRFMINSRSIRNGYASFDGDLFNHMVRVLRLGTGAPLLLVDEQGTQYQAVIDQVDRDWVVARIVSSLELPDTPSSAPRLTLCQALPKGEKTELVLQKGTELGVHEFWLFGGRRSVARVREEQLDSKLERWNRVAAEAARQCGRCSIPLVRWFPDATAAAEASSHDLRLLLWENETRQNLRGVLAGRGTPASAVVAIGPEGGFDPREVEHLTRLDFSPVSLGSRILRTETAAIAITAVLQYIWEDI